MRFSPKIFIRSLLALCLLAHSFVALAQSPESESLSVNSILDLASDGSVENVSLAGSELLPHVAVAVENTIRRMQFTPVLVEGQPRRVRTSALFRIGFTGSEADRRLAVSVIVMGLPVAMNSPFPRFPEGALARGHGAEVWLLVEVDGSGNVIASEPAAVVLSGLSRATGDDRERAASVSEFIEMSKSAVAL